MAATLCKSIASETRFRHPERAVARGRFEHYISFGNAPLEWRGEKKDVGVVTMVVTTEEKKKKRTKRVHQVTIFEA